MKSSFVLLMGGVGSRTNLTINKTLLEIAEKPIFLYSLETAIQSHFDEYILVIKKTELEIIKTYLTKFQLQDQVKITYGGATRGESVKNGLKAVTTDIVYFHDAARPLVTKQDLDALKEAAENYNCGTLYHLIPDTLKRIKPNIATIDRNNIYAVSTPQFFKKALYPTILNNQQDITDEISLFEQTEPIGFVKESSNNMKFTTIQDLDYLKYQLNKKATYIGHSLDYHPFSDHGTLILGGELIEGYPILEGHSDADVILHVVTEAIMGAALLGDLGTLFPDNDPKYKGIASSKLLAEVVRRIQDLGYEIVNIDITAYLIKPNLKNYKLKMADNIKKLTNTTHVNVKAATLNKRGLIALEAGIGAEAVVLLKK